MRNINAGKVLVHFSKFFVRYQSDKGTFGELKWLGGMTCEHLFVVYFSFARLNCLAPKC